MPSEINYPQAEINLIDTHAHIFLKEFSTDLNKIIERARKAGINKILLPNIDSGTIDDLLNTEVLYPEICFPMMGLHPCSVKENWEHEIQRVEEWLSRKKFVAIGEVGLDLHWDKSTFEWQKEALIHQIKLAKKYNLPLVLHTRNAINETLELISQNHFPGMKGVFHCFSGSEEQAKKIIEMGFYLGIGGVITFKNSGLDKSLKEIDISNMVLETDSPYLAPAPFRGKRNEPAYLVFVLKKLAEVKGVKEGEVAERTTVLAEKIFLKSSV